MPLRTIIHLTQYASAAILAVSLFSGCQSESEEKNKPASNPNAKRKQLKLPALYIGFTTEDNQRQPCVWLDESDNGRLDQPPPDAHRWPAGKAAFDEDVSSLVKAGNLKDATLPIRVDERLTCGTLYDVMKACQDGGLKSVQLPGLRPDDRSVSLSIKRPKSKPFRQISITPVVVSLRSGKYGSLDSVGFFGFRTLSVVASTDQRRIDKYIKDRPNEEITRSAAANSVGVEDTLNELNRELARYATLQRELIYDKEKLDNELLVKIVADDGLQLRYLLQAIDECRYQRVTFDGKTVRRPMFPRIEVVGFYRPLTKPVEVPIRLK